MRGLVLLLSLPVLAALHTRAVVPRPRLAAVRCAIDEFDAATPLPAAADLVAQSGGGERIAVSGLTPQGQEGQQQQPYVGVPPPSAQPTPPPSMLQKARAPFMGLTFLATAAVATWQSKRMFANRQTALLNEFAATMVFHLGDERELSATLRTYRQQLGPGRYTAGMYTAFMTVAATNLPIGVKSVQNLKAASALFGLTDAATAQLLEKVAGDLDRQPSVLGKLCFLAERAMPTPASMAKLRTKFPNWSFDTVTALQRAMLENLYRDLCEDLPPGSTPDATTLDVLGLSEADARRLMTEVQERKEAEATAEAAKAEEELRQAKLQKALEEASQSKTMRTRSTKPAPSPPPAPPPPPPPPAPAPAPSSPPVAATDDDDDEPILPTGGIFGPPSDDEDTDGDAPDGGDVVTAGDGTHEYECTKCGYILFPAAGREFKFFGAGFSCPGCGAGKDDFVDNGPVE